MAEKSADPMLPSVREICTTMGSRFLRRLGLLVLYDFTLIQGLQKVVGPKPDQLATAMYPGPPCTCCFNLLWQCLHYET